MSKSSRNRRAAGERGSSIIMEQFDLTTIQCMAVLALLIFTFFHKILLGQAYFWEDFLYQNYPFRSFAATSLAMGQMPLWNPYTFNGMPFLADIQTTVLYLPSLLLTLLVNNGSLSYYWLELVIILHFLLAGVGMFYLARSFNLRNIPALFAGSAYMLSGYMIVHAIHQQNVTLVAWYPLVFLFFRKALNQQGWLYVFVCGLVLGHSILAGYPQLSLFLYFFLALYFLSEFFASVKEEKQLSRSAMIMSAKAATIIVISLALAMVQLLPTFELSDLSQRAQITFEKASEGSLAWSQLATLFFPKLFGSAGATGYEYFGPGQYFYYWETCVYLGILPLLLTAISITLWKRNRHVAFLWGVALFSIMFALGDNFFIFRIFFEFVPGFSKFRIPARMGILLTFAAAMLSAFSLQHLLYESRGTNERKVFRNVLLVVGAAGILTYVLIVSGSFSNSISGASYKQVAPVISKGVTPSLFILIVSTALLFGMIVRGNLFRFAGLFLVAFFFFDMFMFGGNQNNGTVNPLEYFRQRSELVEFLKNDKELFRVNTRNAQGILPGWDRNQGMLDRVFTLEGYTPLALQRAYAPMASVDQSYDLLNVKYKTVFDPRSGQQNIVEHTTRLPRAFFVYNVHVATSDEDLRTYLKSPAFDHRTTAVLEKQPERRIEMPATPPKWDARITNYTNNTIVVQAKTTHNGLLVLSEIFYPGWRAYVDGIETEIYRADYNLRSVFVIEGEHQIVVKFEPPTFMNGLWISAVSLVACCGGIVLSLRNRNKADLASKQVA